MQKYLLGIDVGTTGTKTMLFSQNGTCIGHAYCAYSTQTPQVGWSEQNPEDWWQAVISTVRQVCDHAETAEAVTAMALSVQGGTLVAVDRNGQPVRPAMVWNDTRCTEERELFLREVGASIYQKTGWALGNGMNALQIRWLREHEPENFRKTARFLSVPDYLSYRLTGRAAIDISNLGINQLGNITAGSYDREILRFSGISEDQLAEICPSGTVIGSLTEDAAEALGLSADCVLVSGAHDQYAVALGAGAVHSGDILVGSGTCWVVTQIQDRPYFQSGLSQSVAAVPGMWGSLSSLSSGGICLDWLRKNIIQTDHEPLCYERMNQEVCHRKAAEDGLFFYPFSGLCTDSCHLEKGTFVGMELSHDRFHLARAVMEGVVFQIVWMLDAFQTDPTMKLKLTGGAARSPFWVQLLADVSGRCIQLPEVVDLACVGAAILAGVGVGVFQSHQAGYQTLCVGERTVRPNAGAVQRYRPLLSRYRQQAEHLGKLYHL